MYVYTSYIFTNICCMFLLFCVFLVSVPDVPVEEMQFDVIHLCCGEIFLHFSRHIVEVKTEL